MTPALRALCFFVVFSAFLSATEVLYFMPYEKKDALSSLIKTIDSSEKTIDISIYSFTHTAIAKSLKNAAKRGVKIRIIYDKESNQNNPHSTIGYLSKYKGIKTCLLQGRLAKNAKYHGIMHQKLAIIDDKTLFLGSANWSKNAFENNYESLLKTDDKPIIQKATSYFKKMFLACTPY
ncbi:phospholipase D-like domain-containing protein [Helicobacter sp. 11S02596-1]|uniref:phospholipase D-like domain-containing protein n=1 Tax=Helicobacter sp. 11S02596-1 TaxID=1476194 RepID=UPI000BA665AB|nr:nuclease NucT [Helicobacter sp. 11S02596-1]